MVKVFLFAVESLQSRLCYAFLNCLPSSTIDKLARPLKTRLLLPLAAFVNHGYSLKVFKSIY